ncbi:YbdD/YjiX family protein [Psychromicrobium sp. YIM B11713]|uniref:YbdD/YjiX family protein n=1 Tax=Psychromicrobium sp. YIM B11713 TaxID=3145233 RepID=UPI00374EB89D
MNGSWNRVLRLMKAVRWYIKGLMGEDAYQKYQIHQLTAHPGAPMMTERQFWRDHTDRQDANPQGHCC